jgi:hypothetical protein
VISKYKDVEYAIGVGLDITEEKEKDFEIETYHQIIEELQDDKQIVSWGAKVLENNNIYLFFVSNNFEKLTGYPRTEFINHISVTEIQIGIPLNHDPYENKKQLYSLIHPDYHNQIREMLKSSITPKKFGFKIITSEKNILEFETTISKREVAGLNTFYFGKAKVIN